MKNRPLPTVTSFIIRFVQDASTMPDGGANYRGFIRHIQSDQELTFTCWQDALTFIENYVPQLHEENQAGKTNH